MLSPQDQKDHSPSRQLEDHGPGSNKRAGSISSVTFSVPSNLQDPPKFLRLPSYSSMIDSADLIQDWQEKSIATIEVGETGVIARLFRGCLDLYSVLLRGLPRSQCLSKKDENILRRCFHTLTLWAEGHSVWGGKLDSILEGSKRLQRRTLSTLHSICGVLLKGLSKIIALDSGEERLRLLCSSTQVLFDQTKWILDGLDDTASDASSDSELSEDELEEGLAKRVVEEIRTYTDCLVNLSSAIKCPAMDPKHNDEPSIPRLEKHSAYDYYADLITTKYPKADADLVECLGKANWNRYQRMQHERDSNATARMRMRPTVETTIFKISKSQMSNSEFKDSGLGTSLPTEPSAYAKSVISIVSSFSGGEQVRIPPLPAEAKNGAEFECTACGTFIRATSSRVWRKHLFLDLQPYTCFFTGCVFSAKPFAARQDWSNHLELDHSFGPSWQSVECQLCLEPTGDGKSYILKHFARHMEDIALAALPREVNSKAGSEADDSDSEQDEEEQQYRKALGIQERTLGSNHIATQTSMHNLAFVLQKHGKHEEAERLSRSVVEKRANWLGANHPATLSSKHDLAFVLRSQRRYAEAEQLNRSVLAERERMFGNGHIDTMASIHQLVMLLKEQGKYEEASSLNEQSLGSSKGEPNHGHTRIQSDLYSLANMDGTFGKRHPDSLAATHQLAVSLVDKRRYEEAEDLFKQAVAGRSELLGRYHNETLASVEGLQSAMEAQGKKGMREQAYEFVPTNAETEHPDASAGIADQTSPLQIHSKDFEEEDRNEVTPANSQAKHQGRKILLPEDDRGMFRKWLLPRLKKLSDADEDMLAEYMIAQITSEESEAIIRRIFLDSLSRFPRSDAGNFVDDVLKTLKDRTYVPKEEVPVVSIPLCRKPKLSEIIENTASPPYSLSSFMAFLSQNHCLENLEFIMDANRYRKHYFKLIDDGNLSFLQSDETTYVLMLWKRMMDTYIRGSRIREVNLPRHTRESLLKLAEGGVPPPHPSSLDIAVSKVRELMEETVLVPFLNSASRQSPSHEPPKENQFSTSTHRRSWVPPVLGSLSNPFTSAAATSRTDLRNGPPRLNDQQTLDKHTVAESERVFGRGSLEAKHSLSEFACKHIHEKLVSPILTDESLMDFHSLIHDISRRIKGNTISNLRDLEKTLLRLAPGLSTTPALYFKFCKRAIQLLQTIVWDLSEQEQRLPSDPPYTNNYFLDLIKQVRLIATTNEVSMEDHVRKSPNGADDFSELKRGEQAGNNEAQLLKEQGPFLCMSQDCRGGRKRFTTWDDLERHESKVHWTLSMQPPYRCAAENCRSTKLWPRLDKFKQHIQRMHPDENEETLIRRSATPSYRCASTNCRIKEKIWPRLDNFKQHIRRLHTDENEKELIFRSIYKPVFETSSKHHEGKMACNHEECLGLTFYRQCEWRKHMDKHNSPYKCNVKGCEKLQGFTSSSSLLHHEREVHKMHPTLDSLFLGHNSHLETPSQGKVDTQKSVSSGSQGTYNGAHQSSVDSSVPVRPESMAMIKEDPSQPRFNIPAERTLLNIDQLITDSNDSEELKELKRQKRLLQNRQAALDARDRKIQDGVDATTASQAPQYQTQSSTQLPAGLLNNTFHPNYSAQPSYQDPWNPPDRSEISGVLSDQYPQEFPDVPRSGYVTASPVFESYPKDFNPPDIINDVGLWTMDYSDPSYQTSL